MPAKKPFMYSIDPVLYARSHAPATTIAMGLKNSQASSLCWADQVRREQRISDKWNAEYDPEHRQEMREVDAVERTRERDRALHEAYMSFENNPEIYSVLYKKAPPSHSDKANTMALSPASSTPGTAAAAESVGAPGSAEALRDTEVDEHTFARAARSVTQDYLRERCDHRTLQQRFLNGPMTAAQEVGWAVGSGSGSAETSLATSSASRRQACLRQSGAYHKPEDDEHSILLGYDYTPK